MRIDCYNACECPISELECGDTFYREGVLYIKANVSPFMTAKHDCFALALGVGLLTQFDENTMVTIAETKVVTYNEV